MKKVIIKRFALVLAFACVCTAIIIYANRPIYLVTGKAEDVLKITATKDIFDLAKKTTIDISPADAKDVFNELRSAKTKAFKHPKHLESRPEDTKYTIMVYYSNGKSDMIQTAGDTLHWFRFLNTKWSDGDPGYVISNENEKLLYLIESYFK
jgi:hypothetical protein